MCGGGSTLRRRCGSALCGRCTGKGRAATTARRRTLRCGGTGKDGTTAASGPVACHAAKGRAAASARDPSSGKHRESGAPTRSEAVAGGRGSARSCGAGLMSDARARALEEIAFCEAVLAKGGCSVLTETLAGVPELNAWDHYPAGDVFDPASNAQWFYHCHPAEEGTIEHGHFHCFLRPAGPDGPIHHLCAIGVDAHGRLLRLFTVNQWVVGDDWADADTTIALLPHFDMQMPRPSFLVNRWLTAIFGAYESEIADLVRQRDAALAARPEDARQDRSIEVLSELDLSAA